MSTIRLTIYYNLFRFLLLSQLLPLFLIVSSVCADFDQKNLDKKRFFLMGDGKLHIKNVITGKEANVVLLRADGSFNRSSFERIDEVFNFPTTLKGENVSLRLIFLLDYFSDLVAPGKKIMIKSGYRSEDYNAEIRKKGGNTARTSTHIDGMAVDFYIEGVDGKRLWHIVKEHQCCGVGHYGGDVIHLDSGRPRFWEAHTSKVHTGESDYNRKIYLSTEYDRYKNGEKVRLSLSSISDFGFGIKNSLFLISQKDYTASITLAVEHHSKEECFMINDRKNSRFIYFYIPKDIKNGKYRIKMDFCYKPFEQMPNEVLSNEIEITEN